MDGDRVDPIVEILPEGAGRDRGGQISIGGGHDPRVDAAHGRGTHAPKGALLEEGEQLRLSSAGEISDLVEEERPAVGDLHQAELALARIGKGAPLVAEQLALDEVLGNRRAVQLHERTARTRRAFVEHPRDGLFSGTALAGHQDQSHGALGDHFHLGEQPLHSRRRVDEGTAALAPFLRRQIGDPVFQPAGTDGVVNRGHDFFQLERLLDEIVAAELHRGDRALDRAVSGDQDDLGVGRFLFHAPQDVETVGVPEHQIEQHDVGTGLLKACPGLGTRTSRSDVEPLAREQRLNRLPNQGLVIHHQDGRAQRTTGICISKTAPQGSTRFAATIRPPCSRRMFWLTARPRPCPSGLVVKNGLNSSRSWTGVNPAPRSDTRMAISSRPLLGARAASTSMEPPGAVASTALTIRFTSACVMSCGSTSKRRQIGALSPLDAHAAARKDGRGSVHRGVDQSSDPGDLDPWGEGSGVVHEPPHQPFDAGDLVIESVCGVDHRPATWRGRTLPFEQLNGCLHPGQRIQDFVRELCRQLADCRQLLALDEPPAMLEQRRVRLLQLFDNRAHLIAQRLQAGTSRRKVNARSLGSRFDLDLELIHRLRDPPSPQKPDQQAGDGAGDAGPHQNPRQSAHRPLGCGQRLLRVGARDPPKLGEQIA